MQQYIARRLFAAIPTLLLVTFIIFALIRLLPGDVVMARVSQGGFTSKQQLAQMRVQLGIDRPFFTQYLDYVGGLLHGDLGKSLWTTHSVGAEIKSRLPLTLQLTIMSLLLGILIAVPVGIVSAIRRNTWMDYAGRFFSILGLSLPDFWLGTLLILFLSLEIHWLPKFAYFPLWQDPSRNLQALIFPALIVGYRLSAITARMMRSALLEVLGEDYIRTAWSKGLRERTVIWRHALRGAMIPVVTIVGGQLGFLLGGLVIIETVFNLPGVGRLAFDAISVRDYPIIQGVVLMMATLFIVVNLAIDLAYAGIDPRIRYA